MNINYIAHLKNALADLSHRQAFHSSHISLYVALFHSWNQHHFENEFPVIRETTMRQSKIGSRNTYLRCLKDLHNCGLITYTPGFDIIHPAMISITPFANDGELLNDTSVDRIIFDTPYSQHGIRKVPGRQLESGHRAGLKKDPTIKQLINNVKRESVNRLTPSQEEVIMYFGTNNLPLEEGRKFFLYYQSRGWRVKDSPIQDWQSAAQKWMLNVLHTSKPGQLHVNQNKRYDIPL